MRAQRGATGRSPSILAQAEHFINGLQALQRLYGLTQIYAMYHAQAGFAKTAADTLMQHNIMVIEYAETKAKTSSDSVQG